MTHTYTFEDIQYLFHEPLTPNQQASLVNYVNTGEVPPADPCQSCEPNDGSRRPSATAPSRRRSD